MATIKEMNQSDMHRLVELSLMWEKEDSCYGYRANTEDDLKDRYILAAYDDELIAYVFGKEEVQDKQTSVINKNMHYFEIEELYVHPSYRSRGIGKQLMESLEKELKKKGLHLKAIRDLLPKLQQAVGQAVQESIPEEAVEILPAKMTAETNARTVEEEPETVEVREVTDDRQAQFYEILERLLRQMMLKKRQEERYKRVDEAIRRHQQSRKEAAATVETSDRKKKKGRK